MAQIDTVKKAEDSLSHYINRMQRQYEDSQQVEQEVRVYRAFIRLSNIIPEISIESSKTIGGDRSKS